MWILIYSFSGTYYVWVACDDKNWKGDPFSDFAFDCKIRNPDFKIKIWISQSDATLEFVPEETRLLIADEDDQFFFQIRWVLQMCQDFNSQDFELIICGIVSAISIAIVFKLLIAPDKLNC